VIEPGSDYSDQVFEKVSLEQAQIDSSTFYDCTFDRCSLVETTFRACRFVSCVFRDCDLSLMQVPHCSFTTTQFEKSRVIGVDWTKAHWAAKGLGKPIDFSTCAISHSTFIGLKLPGIRIRSCMALDVDFREASLFRADFTATDLSGSLFLATDLTEADLSQARNYQIDPSENVIKRAKFALPEAMSLLYSLDIVLVED
jgi:uncharacterized protein YjbI with pentapeptide repeats